LGKEPAVVIGAVVAAVSIAATLQAGGGFNDGVQLVEILAIVVPVLGVFGIRATVFSSETVARDYVPRDRAPDALDDEPRPHEHGGDPADPDWRARLGKRK